VDPEVVLDITEPDVTAVRTDETLLAQVLRNLLHNALKFTLRGRVTMTATCEDDMLVIAVTDTGVGIPTELHERIFEEFYQVRQVDNTAGTGLGLPYARQLVTLLGGSMHLTSAPGVGSTFTVRLPVTTP
jgi:signal transduction histidine kinase